MLKTVFGSNDAALSYVILGFIDPRRDASSSPELSMEVVLVVHVSFIDTSPLTPCDSRTDTQIHLSMLHHTQSELDIAGKKAE